MKPTIKGNEPTTEGTKVSTQASSMLHQLWQELCEAKLRIAALEVENRELRKLKEDKQ